MSSERAREIVETVKGKESKGYVVTGVFPFVVDGENCYMVQLACPINVPMMYLVDSKENYSIWKCL